MLKISWTMQAPFQRIILRPVTSSRVLAQVPIGNKQDFMNRPARGE